MFDFISSFIIFQIFHFLNQHYQKFDYSIHFEFHHFFKLPKKIINF